MKTLLSLAALSLALTACGTASQQPSSALDAQGQAAEARTHIFARDDRPADGNAYTLKLVPNANGTYTITSLTEFGGLRPDGIPPPVSREFGTRFSCSFDAAAVNCSFDARPVDGALTEIKLVKNASGSWDASLHTAAWDRRNGQLVENTTALATRLEEQPAVVVYSRDLRPVDGGLVELKLTQAADGTYAASLRKAGRLGDETTQIAAGLSCNFSYTISCQRDDRPADGVLTKVYLTATAQGVYTANLYKQWFNRIEGREESKTDLLGEGLRRQG